jgi:hypothetical protein
MEYKYLLELLRCGAYDEFFESIKTTLVPFLSPAVYGRSILENSSFIVSSAYPDENKHGTGFVSRLTGASAEFLTMLRFMTVGQVPFFLNSREELQLELKPVLPGWLFTEEEKTASVFLHGKQQTLVFPKNTFSFKLLGGILTVYHNDSRRNTYGKDAVRIAGLELRRGDTVTPIDGSVIPQPYAQKIREGVYDRIDVFFD